MGSRIMDERMDLGQPTYLSIGFVGWEKSPFARTNPICQKRVSITIHSWEVGWLSTQRQGVCVCVCFCSLGASRSWGHATRHFGGSASPLPSGDTQESVTSVCLVAFWCSDNVSYEPIVSKGPRRCAPRGRRKPASRVGNPPGRMRIDIAARARSIENRHRTEKEFLHKAASEAR